MSLAERSKRMRITFGTTAVASVYVLMTWWGAIINCTNSYSCTTSTCSPCNHLNWLGYSGFAAIFILAIDGRTKKWTALLGAALALGMGFLLRLR